MRPSQLLCSLLTACLVACVPSQPEPDSNNLALLAQQDASFEQALPTRPLQFPVDHGAHENFRLEWWYVTTNLQDSEGRQFGAQWTLFRSALRADATVPTNAWHTPQLYMGHMAITWPDGHHAAQRYARGGDHNGLSQAGVESAPFAAWLDDWSLAATDDGVSSLLMNARDGGFAIDLQLTTDQPLLLHGVNGFSQKHAEGGGSHYYSQPFYQASGTLTIDDEPVQVSGQAWLDREWSSQFLKADQLGWDWFALHLDDGSKLMLYQLRQRDGERYLYAVRIEQGGVRTVLNPEQVDLRVLDWQHVANRELPLQWQVSTGNSSPLVVTALHPQQWMDLDFAYWEGVVLVSDVNGNDMGRGYMELTGY